MEQISHHIIVFVLAILAVAIAGIVAGFSPTLYITQVAAAAKPKTARRITFVLMAGVLFATIVLLVLFQTFSLTSLVDIINSTVQALLVSIVFNVIVGLLFIFGGLHYVRTKDTSNAYAAEVKKTKKYGSTSAIFTLGFVKTFVSISGVTAIFIGGNIIASTTTLLLEKAILAAVFLAASIAPFFVILYILQRSPKKINTLVRTLKEKLARFNYRTTVGYGAIILGGAIIIFNIMMALFY